eukprot:5068952-Pleurochrysis_carterae.AAC.1
MRELDDLCRYMTEPHLSKYASSTRANSCDSFSGLRRRTRSHQAHCCHWALPRAGGPCCRLADGSSDSTFSDDETGPSAEVPELASEFADAEPLEEADASSSSPHVRWARVVAGRKERWKGIQARMDVMEARTRRN